MQPRMYKGLMRFILFLISFQFFSLALTPGDGGEISSGKHHSLKAEHSRSFSLSVFFEESKAEKEGEGEEEKLLHCFEIADLSYISLILNRAHAFWVPKISIEQLYDLRPPLFKMHSIFII
jgi:hypothetical protein